MTGYATWEGMKVVILRVKNGQVEPEPFAKGRMAAMAESQKHPIGLILIHSYDTGGKGGTHPEDYSVYYKGKNAEILPAKDLDHPHIRMLESFLSQRDEISELASEYIPHMRYEKPDVDEYSFRKKKSAKPKPKRKVVKKCKCK